MTNEIKGPALAEMIGVSTRHLHNLEKSGIVVKTDRGAYALRESIRNFCAYLRKESAPGSDYEADKGRLMKAKADRAEIETAQRAGKLVLTDRIGKVVADAIGIAVSKLGQVGDKVAALCILEKSAAGAAEIINNANRAACEELYAMDIAAIALESAEQVESITDPDNDNEADSDTHEETE
jgi:hypothetical protein